MRNFAKTVIVIGAGMLSLSPLAHAQTASSERSEIGGVYTILEGTKLEYMAVGSDDNVLRWGESNNPLDSKWEITTGEHPEKGKYYQFQSLKNGLFLTASMVTMLQNTMANQKSGRSRTYYSANAGVTNEANFDAQTFTIKPVKDEELIQYAPDVYGKIIQARTLTPIGKARKHTAVRITRFGYDEITDTVPLGVLSNGNIAVGSTKGVFDQKDYRKHPSKYFILVEDDTPNPHTPYNLNNPRAASHSAARAMELRAGHSARAMSAQNRAKNKATRQKKSQASIAAIKNEFDKLGRAMNLATDFKHAPDAAISGHNMKKLTDVTVAQCKNYCAEETAFICKSFDYNRGGRYCHLSDKNASDVGSLKTDYPGNPWDYYEFLYPNSSRIDPVTGEVEIFLEAE